MATVKRKLAAEPWKGLARVRPEACDMCLIPFDRVEREALVARLPAQEFTWHHCLGCGRSVCSELVQLAEEK
jgi:hypothetical protein